MTKYMFQFIKYIYLFPVLRTSKKLLIVAN